MNTSNVSKAELRKSLEKSLEWLKDELTQIRTGRLTPSILDNIRVEAYGSKMSVKELGSVTILENSTLTITPWDKSLLNPIAKSIRESDLKIEPIIEGDRIRLVFPGLTEERRKEFAKLVSEKVEDCRQRIRRIRQEEMRQIDTQFEEKSVSEDERFSSREEVEKLVKEFNTLVEEAGERKKQEIMTV